MFDNIDIPMPSKASKAAKERCLGGKRCVRVSVSIQTDYDSKLTRLATSCGMAKATLADALLRVALDSPPLIDWLQEKYNKNEQYLVKPIVVRKDGREELEYY